MKSYKLDDGSEVVDLKTTIAGVEYSADSFMIRRVDRNKSSFSVEFRGLYHKDTSMFDHSAVGQMRIHAEFVLKRLVSEWLEMDPKP